MGRFEPTALLVFAVTVLAGAGAAVVSVFTSASAVWLESIATGGSYVLVTRLHTNGVRKALHRITEPLEGDHERLG